VYSGVVTLTITDNGLSTKESEMEPFVKRIYRGKKTKREPEHHEFIFPGGNINIQRTSDDDYWVHIVVNKGQVLDDIPSRSKPGKFVDSRVDLLFEETQQQSVIPINNVENAGHIAVRISTAA